MPSLKDMREKAKEAGLMKLDKLIAAAANIGLSCQPSAPINTPAAKGIPIML